MLTFLEIVNLLLSVGSTVVGSFKGIKQSKFYNTAVGIAKEIRSKMNQSSGVATKILNALTSKNSQELANMLTSNPTISRTASAILKDQKRLDDISAEISKYQGVIDNAVNQLQMSDYSNLIDNLPQKVYKEVIRKVNVDGKWQEVKNKEFAGFGKSKNEERVEALKAESDNASKQIDALTNQLKAIQEEKPRTINLDSLETNSLNQNITGGLKH